MLTLVSTPIGNLKDISFRAVSVLKNADTILCEDTRTSKRLLDEYGISTPLLSFHAFNEASREDQIVELLKDGKEVALISDAGTPGICDPGARLVRRCREEGIRVSAVPGACAWAMALSLYGKEEGPFQFLGFLPKKEGDLKKVVALIMNYPGLSVVYEAPHHLKKTLDLMESIAPEAKIFVARELTKKFEETVTGTAKELKGHWEEVRGELVLIFEEEKGFGREEMGPKQAVDYFEGTFGASRKEAIKMAADYLERPKREIYRLLLNPSDDLSQLTSH